MEYVMRNLSNPKTCQRCHTPITKGEKVERRIIGGKAKVYHKTCFEGMRI